MRKIVYQTEGVCARKITVDLDDQNKIHNLQFQGGCSGNLQAIAKLLEGMDKDQAISLLEGNRCGNRDTSCADQLTKALKTK